MDRWERMMASKAALHLAALATDSYDEAIGGDAEGAANDAPCWRERGLGGKQ